MITTQRVQKIAYKGHSNSFHSLQHIKSIEVRNSIYLRPIRQFFCKGPVKHNFSFEEVPDFSDALEQIPHWALKLLHWEETKAFLPMLFPLLSQLPEMDMSINNSNGENVDIDMITHWTKTRSFTALMVLQDQIHELSWLRKLKKAWMMILSAEKDAFKSKDANCKGTEHRIL